MALKKKKHAAVNGPTDCSMCNMLWQMVDDMSLEPEDEQTEE